MTSSQMQWINDKTRELLIEGSAGSGKGLALDTLLPTPTGFVTMGDLCVGDSLFDELGNVCHVTYKSSVHHIKCYKVTFDDGFSVIVDKDHRWRYKAPKGKFRVNNTKFLYDHIRTRRSRDIPILMSKAVELSEKDLRIHPYLLGVWIGCNDDPYNGCIPRSIDSSIRRDLVFSGVQLDDYTDNYILVLGMKEALREYNLLLGRHIPQVYLRGSISQRIALLQGIMDTCGDISSGGECTCRVHEDFMNGLRELLYSLGIKSSVHRNGCFAFFTFVTTLNVFRLEDKVGFIPDSLPEECYYRRIVSITNTGSVPTQCITVDSPSHLFLCSEEFIPTHNTLFACYKVIFYALTYPKASVYVYRKTLPSLKRTSWKEIRTCLDNMSVPYEENKSEGKITFNNGSQIFFGALDESSKVRSINADLIYIEQAEEVTNDEFYIELMLRLGRGEASKRKGGYSQMLMVVQPESEDHWIYKRFHEFTDATVEFEREKRDNSALGKPYRSYDEVLASIQERRKTAHFHYSENFKLPAFQRKYYDDLKNEDYELWLRYSAGKWGKLTDVVYPNYDTVVVRDIKDCEIINFGADFGFNNPSCFLLMGWYDSECYVYDEVYVTKHTNPEFITAIKDMLFQHKLLPTHLNTGFADAAEPDRIEEFRQNDFPIEGGVKDVKAKIETTKQTRIHIHPRCVNTIREIKSYKYRKNRDGVTLDEPVKVNDHAMDALAYGVYGVRGALSPTRPLDSDDYFNRILVY